VAHLLAINLVAFVLVCAAIGLPMNGPAPPAGKPALDLPSQAHATVYALLTFLLRKSDLLVVALFMPLGYVGAFKLAFLLAEAPSQFVQAFLGHQDAGHAERQRGQLRPPPRRCGSRGIRSCSAVCSSRRSRACWRWPRRC
jgi:hypothetical protein